MTIDEKIKQAAEKYAPIYPNDGHTSCLEQCAFIAGADVMKFEMLADMQKLAEALDSVKSDLEFFHHASKRYCESGQEKQDVTKTGTPIRAASLKIEKALAEFNSCGNTFRRGANFLKSEMLADMQKMAEALEFYADEFNWLYNQIKKSDCEEIAFNRVLNKPVPKGLEFESGGKKARQALADFNAKYKEQK